MQVTRKLQFERKVRCLKWISRFPINICVLSSYKFYYYVYRAGCSSLARPIDLSDEEEEEKEEAAAGRTPAMHPLRRGGWTRRRGSDSRRAALVTPTCVAQPRGIRRGRYPVYPTASSLTTTPLSLPSPPPPPPPPPAPPPPSPPPYHQRHHPPALSVSSERRVCRRVRCLSISDSWDGDHLLLRSASLADRDARSRYRSPKRKGRCHS